MINDGPDKTPKQIADASYYQRNREKKIAAAGAYQRNHRAAKNRNNQKWQRENRETLNTAVRSWRQRNPEANMIYGARERAKKLDVAFSITINDIHIPETCPVFGFPLERGTGQKQDNSPSLDRIDNTKGYIPGNIVVVSWLANRLKSNATVDQLKAIVAFYEAQAQKISSSSL